MNCNLLRFALVTLSLLLIPAFAKAQVHGPGPSDPALFDTVINLPPDPNIGDAKSIGWVTDQTTQLNVMDGGTVGSSFTAYSGSEVNISGGTVSFYFQAERGSEVNISGGALRYASTAHTDSVVNISGGTVGSRFDAHSGSEVNISGGYVGHEFDAYGGEVNISGGTVGSRFDAHSGSEVNISGGTVGSAFKVHPGSDVQLFGGEFNLNGATFTDSTITLSTGDVLTGTLTDGSAFYFSNDTKIYSDDLIGVTLTPTALPTLDTTPIVVNTAFPTRPSGLRAGQTLTLQDGGELSSNFEVVDATLNIEGGSLGSFAGAIQSGVNISGGTVGSHFDAESGSEVNISGGTVGYNFKAYSGSEVNISGGTVRSGFDAHSGSVVNISGGIVDNDFNAFSGSEVNLLGTQFLLDGVLLESLATGEAFTVTEGDVTLSGLLADGTPFDFDLNRTNFSTRDFFAFGSTLTVTLVPEPSSLLLGTLASVGVLMRRRQSLLGLSNKP